MAPHLQAERRLRASCFGRVVCVLLAVAALNFLVRESGTFVGSASGWARPSHRGGAFRRCAPGQERPFSRDKLAAETEDPFVKPRIFLFGGLAVSGLIGFIFIVPRLLGSALGAPKAAPIMDVVQDLGVNAVAVVVCGGIAAYDADQEQKREQQKEEGALVARVRVLPQGEVEASEGTIKLSACRSSKSSSPQRPVLCFGDLDYCMKCLDATREISQAMKRSDFLFVPILTGDNGLERSEELEEAVRGVPYVAIPKPGMDGAAVRDWRDLIELQRKQATEQGADYSQGLVIIVKKNGRIGLRALGIPDWRAMTGEVAARVAAGMDTENI